MKERTRKIIIFSPRGTKGGKTNPMNQYTCDSCGFPFESDEDPRETIGEVCIWCGDGTYQLNKLPKLKEAF